MCRRIDTRFPEWGASEPQPHGKSTRLTTVSVTDITAADMADPLTPAVFHILLALAGGRLHGYGIAKEILKQTNGEVRMGPGTLYGTLQRLLDLTWVEPSEHGGSGDPRRRYYRLTGLGRRALEAEVNRMDALVRAARGARSKLPNRA